MRSASRRTRSLPPTRAELAQPLEVRLSVDVRLVGFEGDGCGARERRCATPRGGAHASPARSGGGARLHAADFAPFLEALRLDVDAAALDGAAAGALVRSPSRPLRRVRCAAITR